MSFATRAPLAFALLALAAAGCSAEQFAQVNTAFQGAKSVSGAAASAQVPAAAIATALGAFKVVEKLSLSSSGIIASGGGNIVSAGGGNIVSAGGGNVVAGGSGNFQAPSFALLQAPVTESVKEKDVELTFTYTTSVANGTATSTISDLTGKTQGFTVKLSGTFSFTPQGAAGLVLQQANPSAPGSVNADFKGMVSFEDFSMDMETLKINTRNPLPANSEVASFRCVQKNAGKQVGALEAKVKTDANSRLDATGTLTDEKGQTKPITFGENNPNGVVAN